MSSALIPDDTSYEYPGHPVNVPGICGAKNRQGKVCRARPMANGRCYHHGGAQKHGIEHHSWKHGRFSKYLPTSLGEIAYDAARNPQLADMRDIIGVYEARLAYLMQLTGTGASPERFFKIQEQWEKVRVAASLGKAGAAMHKDAMAKLDTLIMGEEGDKHIGHDYMVWRDMDVAAKNYKLLQESQRKLEIESHALVPASKVAEFATNILVVVRQEVLDNKVWARVQARLTDIIGASPAVLEAAHKARAQQQTREAGD